MHGCGFAGRIGCGGGALTIMRWRSDLQAEKAAGNAAIRQTFWWPWVGRTKTKAIVRRPHHGSRRGFAACMKEKLPQFQFNNKWDWWEAGLEELGRAKKAFSYVRLSDGAWEYLNEQDK